MSERSWAAALIKRNSRIIDAIHNINGSCLQIALVVDEDNVLLGTITDGDIRRGLLCGIGIDECVENVMNTSPIVAPPTMCRDLVRHMMQMNCLLQLPVVDERRRVIGLHLWNSVISSPDRSNLMVIMAGGKGTRLRPYTEDCPKPMLPIAGKPILEHILAQAKEDGFRNFVISVHYLSHIIEEYFGSGEKWGVRISYLHEDHPLGTAGALGLLKPRPEEPIVVTNGDVLTAVRYGEMLDFHTHHHAIGTMAVRLHEWQHPFGVVQTQGVDIVAFEEKPVYRTNINAGIYILNPEALHFITTGKQCDMPSVFEELRLNNNKIIAYPMHEVWTDIGRADDLERARNSIHAEGK